MFKTELDLRKKDGRNMELLSDLIYEGSEKITVPTGFVTDGASVPKPVWWFCSPFAGNHLKPAVLHDYLCVLERDQRETDLLFLEVMRVNGVGWFKRVMMYQAVKMFQRLRGEYI